MANKANSRVESPRRLHRRVVTGVTALALVAASCSTSVTKSDGTTTPKSDSDATTTVAKPTTTRGPLTEADLEAMLPTATDIGTDYRLNAADDDSSPDPEADESDDMITSAMKDACPEAASLMEEDDEEDGPKAKRSFSTDDGRELEVELASGISTSRIADRASLKQAVEAIDKCKTIELNSDGIDFTGTLSMQMDDDFGDFGATMGMKFRGESDLLPAPFEIEFVMRVFVVGDVGVTLTALGALDETTLESIPPDTDILDAQAKRMTDLLAET